MSVVVIRVHDSGMSVPDLAKATLEITEGAEVLLVRSIDGMVHGAGTGK
jgi:hypothetical protein